MDDVVACLLDAGADRNAQNADGKSAVDMAYRASTRALLLAPPTATVEPTPGNDPTIAEAVAVQSYAHATVAVPMEWSAVTAERETLLDFCAPSAAATALSPTPSISRSFRSMATSASSSTTLTAPTTPALAAVAASAPAATVMATPAHHMATAVAPPPPPPAAVAATASTTAAGPGVDIALDLPVAPTTPVRLLSTAEPTATSSHGDLRPLAVPAE